VGLDNASLGDNVRTDTAFVRTVLVLWRTTSLSVAAGLRDLVGDQACRKEFVSANPDKRLGIPS
jgi:hypothetical protein